ncbi:MAG: endolytic transglycosylase MltG, partial [Solirubrobacterales bacterium]
DIQADTYNMAKGMSYGGAIDRLSGSKQGLASLAIPEGLSRPEIAELVSDAGVSGDYEAATVSAPGFKPAKYGAKNPPSLEGFLFPATYELDPGSTVDQLVPMQLQAFTQNIAKVKMRYAKTKNLTPYDVVIIASMIDREVMVPKERPLVAAVIYNRLHKNIPLGIDATTRFETGNFDQPLTSEQLQKDSPYNTHTRAGLTPGPIGNPGLAALKAAAAPAKVPFLYYVVKPGTCGEHTFVRTEAEFNAAVAKYNAARDAAGGNSPTSC